MFLQASSVALIGDPENPIRALHDAAIVLYANVRQLRSGMEVGCARDLCSTTSTTQPMTWAVCQWCNPIHFPLCECLSVSCSVRVCLSNDFFLYFALFCAFLRLSYSFFIVYHLGGAWLQLIFISRFLYFPVQRPAYRIGNRE